jgi:hypothetical protein
MEQGSVLYCCMIQCLQCCLETCGARRCEEARHGEGKRGVAWHSPAALGSVRTKRRSPLLLRNHVFRVSALQCYRMRQICHNILQSACACGCLCFCKCALCVRGGPHPAPASRSSLIHCASPFLINPLLIPHFELSFTLKQMATAAQA